MTKRQLRRKPEQGAARNLRLVPPPKPLRRRKWKLPRNLRSMRKPKYGSNPALLAYEEDLVLAVLVEEGGATLRELMEAHPGRFRTVLLWRTIQRLRNQGKLTGWRSYAPTGGKPRMYERYRPQ